MNNTVVITSIQHPTPAVQAYAGRADCRVVVAGDLKTPEDWHLPGVDYLSPVDQRRMGFQTVADLPWNHYARKMTGYLWAMQTGAEVMIDTDDDNIPLDDWGVPSFDGVFPALPDALGFINIYRYYTDQFIWPRGLPLGRILDDGRMPEPLPAAETAASVGVWQGLVHGDPDVDAIYRLTRNDACTFHRRGPLVLGEGTLTPFNSQNTAFARPLFALLYLPAFVTFRFTDILRGYVAQPIMWAGGYRLGVTGATVYQARNPHDLMADFQSEIPCYLQAERVVDLVAGAVSSRRSVPDNLVCAYETLSRHDIVPPQELTLVQRWVADIASLNSAE